MRETKWDNRSLVDRVVKLERIYRAAKAFVESDGNETGLYTRLVDAVRDLEEGA